LEDGPINMLIVDDEPTMRYSLCQIFRCKGYTVRAADDGFSALREIRETMPDLVLCDLNMPRMSGFELLSVIRRRFPQIFVIAMSGGFLGSEIPPGIAADLFYSKGTGMPTLFQLVSQGIDSQAHPAFALRRTVPVWVQEGASRPVQASSVGHELLIGCPECLRPFAVAVGSSEQSQITDCVHCSTSFQYAIVT